MATTAHIGLTLIEQSQSQKEVTVNMALARLDALLNTGAIDKDLATPPASPTAGDVYLVAASATGDWSGKDGQIAYFDQIWRFIAPREGMRLWVNDEDASYVFDGAAWRISENVSIKAVSGAAYTLLAQDCGKVLELSHSAAITLTLPNSLPQGFHARIMQSGAGQVTCSPASGAALHNRQSFTKTAGQYAVCVLYVSANSGGTAASYVLSGDGA